MFRLMSLNLSFVSIEVVYNMNLRDWVKAINLYVFVLAVELMAMSIRRNAFYFVKCLYTHTRCYVLRELAMIS